MGVIRVVLVGSPERRDRLRGRLPEGVAVVGEADSVAAARAGWQVADAFLVSAASDDDDPLVEELTPRETQVLTLLADGLPNKAIADRLGLSDETVKFHLASIFGKLSASNRTDAVRQAFRRGLVPF